jgi:hypothetical protein
MNPHRLFIAAATMAFAGAVVAQGTPGAANSAGIAPAVPPVPPPTAAPNPAPAPVPNRGVNEGFFRPSPDAVMAPPFTPATPGVTPIDTGKPIVGSSTADRELRDAVASAIAGDRLLQGARINVLVSDGAVTLSGTAVDQAQADHARAVTERLAGSGRVVANISAAS